MQAEVYMISFYLKIKFFVVILVTAALIGVGMISWHYRAKYKGIAFSDQQIVWLLVGLLVIAVVSMGTFLLILLAGLNPWHYLQI